MWLRSIHRRYEEEGNRNICGYLQVESNNLKGFLKRKAHFGDHYLHIIWGIIVMPKEVHMCGIFAYKGSSLTAAEIVFSGLTKLDYRGYDSWGLAVSTGHKLFVKKEVGKIGDVNVNDFPAGNIAFGHTRWATTGKVNRVNSHPHLSTDRRFALVQNGIVENFQELKSVLIKKGYKFKSTTDTEVIVRLIESQPTSNLVKAVRNSFLQLHGRNTIAVIDSYTDQIIALRNGSPLIVGRNKNNFYLSSDTLSLASSVTDYLDLANLEMVVFGKKANFYDVNNGNKIIKQFKPMDFQFSLADKGKYDHFMIKEIMESPICINRIIDTDKQLLNDLATCLKKSKHVYCLGSGSAGNAAAQIAYYLKKFALVDAVSLIGSDAADYYPLFTENDIVIAPSQSGETCDVIEVLEIAKAKGVKVASLVNMPGSMIARLSDYKFSTNAGPEICVMSTKVFLAQICWGYLLAKTIAGKYEQALTDLKLLADIVLKYLKDQNNILSIKKTVSLLFHSHDIFILGKGQNYNIAKEGMVKLIEGTYKHAHAIPAGDLKHYAITIIEKGIYTIVLMSPDDSVNDIHITIDEIKSRGGTVICFPFPEELGDTSAIFNIIPLQLLTYYLAVKLGNSVDKPRHIAKSVTVK